LPVQAYCGQKKDVRALDLVCGNDQIISKGSNMTGKEWSCKRLVNTGYSGRSWPASIEVHPDSMRDHRG